MWPDKGEAELIKYLGRPFKLSLPSYFEWRPVIKNYRRAWLEQYDVMK
jgi:hypothetical protein